MIKKVEFYSEGCLIKANLYLPDPISENEKLPAIVLCHGFAGIKELLLPAYGERFAQNGFIVLAFDYRGFGESEGEKGKILNLSQVCTLKDVRNYRIHK